MYALEHFVSNTNVDNGTCIDSTQLRIKQLMLSMLRTLGSWVDLGMPVFQGLSDGRRAKWDCYCSSERWVYYTVHLMNDILQWRNDDRSVFLFSISLSTEPLLETNCYEQITWIIALSDMWNTSEYNTTCMKVDLVAFVSLEHLWFGYQRDEPEGAVYVHMTIDQGEVDSKLIVNRLECGEEFNDFECITYQNTLLEHFVDVNNKPPPLSASDLRCLILNHFVSALLTEYIKFVESHTPEEGSTIVETFRSHIWQCVAILHSYPTDTTMGTVVALQIGSILQAGLPPPADYNLPYSSEFEAFSSALAKNPVNYEARKCLVECYLDINEVYLAHQHCLVLVEQLPAYADAALEAPKAHTAFAYASELLSTTLHDIHALHQRGEEGYEQLDRIPTVGESVEVEWALDDELVRYTGTIELHPDRRSLCVSYADDTERGAHRRRFENALHLVNINDPQDQYLETYYLVDDSADE